MYALCTYVCVRITCARVCMHIGDKTGACQFLLSIHRNVEVVYSVQMCPA